MVRVVHGRNIPTAKLVDQKIIAAIKEAAPLAPLHNPANLQGIIAAAAVFQCPQVRIGSLRSTILNTWTRLRCFPGACAFCLDACSTVRPAHKTGCHVPSIARCKGTLCVPQVIPNYSRIPTNGYGSLGENLCICQNSSQRRTAVP